ncbi:MAG: immunity 26/phosphotriesterase HocA family protein [Candidatus Hydrogenedentes bacterium]|nr:immunity 26/phosphotriesterase HocA family protein [Candidatus Hydrogenedentota bacterium]
MKQKIVPGDVFEVDLKDGSYAYGRVLRNVFGFYDLRASTCPPVEEIVAHPMIFKIWVMDYAIERRLWRIIGHVPLSQELTVTPRFFKKDPITGRLTITVDGSQEIPATYDECKELECAAVWDPEHVEDRLRDHFEGRKNVWYQYLRP